MSAAKRSTNAAELAKHDVQTVSSETPLEELVRFFLDHKLSCAPVVEQAAGGRKVLIGFVTEKDCLEHLAGELFYGSPRPHHTVATIMQQHPICVAPETDMFAVCSLFVSHGLRHAPVTEPDGHLVGLISRRDLLRFLDQAYQKQDRDYQSAHFPPDRRAVGNLRFF